MHSHQTCRRNYPSLRTYPLFPAAAADQLPCPLMAFLPLSLLDRLIRLALLFPAQTSLLAPMKTESLSLAWPVDSWISSLPSLPPWNWRSARTPGTRLMEKLNTANAFGITTHSHSARTQLMKAPFTFPFSWTQPVQLPSCLVDEIF